MRRCGMALAKGNHQDGGAFATLLTMLLYLLPEEATNW
jgi:hypothetical protein